MAHKLDRGDHVVAILMDTLKAFVNDCLPPSLITEKVTAYDLKLFILVGWDRSFRLLIGPPRLN